MSFRYDVAILYSNSLQFFSWVYTFHPLFLKSLSFTLSCLQVTNSFSLMGRYKRCFCCCFVILKKKPVSKCLILKVIKDGSGMGKDERKCGIRKMYLAFIRFLHRAPKTLAVFEVKLIPFVIQNKPFSSHLGLC